MALYDPDSEYRTPKFLFDASGEQIRTVTHRVIASDIDFNGHVSNQIYVRLASAMASSDYAGKHVIRELHVKFEKECFLDNVLEMTLYRKDDGSFATVIRREDMPEPVCRIISRWDECNITSVSTYGKNNPYSEYGYNRDRENLEQINLMIPEFP